MNAVLNTSIDRGRSFVYTGLDSTEQVSKGAIKIIGNNLVVIAAEKAAGATVRAAQTIPDPDRFTAIYEHEDVTVDTKPGVFIPAGAKLWYSVNDDAFVSSLSQVSVGGACYACATSLEPSDNTTNRVRVAFDGRNTVAETGTGV